MNVLTLMETFAAVVETNSFTAAAEKLGLSKSFVSRQVSELEKNLGARLLYRTTRKLSLSEEGNQFYKHCKLIISEAENAQAEVMDSIDSPKGKIRITLPQSLIISGIGQTLIDFQYLYPDIELEIIATGKIENLVESGIDVAIRIGQLEDSSLISKRLADCRFQVVCAPSYLEKNGEPTQPSDLLNHNCLIYGDSKVNKGWPFRLPNGEDVTVKVKGKLTSNDGHVIVNAMQHGLGICFGPSFLFEKQIEAGSLQLVLEKYYSPPTAVSALYPLNRHLSKRVRILLDFLSEHLTF